ncbi:spore germination protein [Caldisalinibacter kiritimatiensis]|uniref:Spore germination protein GerKA n=1 Tax=Caldisalinibacter kiritimatiensis TaxID=1304284 RepID=R1ATC4_9FIRM|nr:spore germination protein [Caldisalinibacter kiritimatiensis]EOC99881.1 Spore germination protein GerKA [Caldisalinibacter kiritimatiensis]
MRFLKRKNKFISKIIELKKDELGITIRKIRSSNTNIYILYIKQITDRKSISDTIIKPLLQYRNNEELDVTTIIEEIVYIDDIYLDDDENQIIEHILNGQTVIILSNDNKYIVANTRNVEKRNVESPEVQSSFRAPRDSFTENLDTNLSLVRYRVKDENLRIEYMTVGKRTKTKLAIVYVKDIANPKYLEEVRKRLKKINIDGIMESGYIKKLITNNPFNFFPEVGIAERSESASASILNGKICLFIEGSNLALVMPQTFIEFIDSGDDHYEDIYTSVFVKILRILSIFLSLTLSSFYVLFVSFHPDFMPAQYILTLATSRVTVPFNALIEATAMEIVTEILREASIRLPKQIGPAIGIVGTIVIGQAAVTAGLVSPLMVIII